LQVISGLEALVNLDTLHLANNEITKVEGLGNCGTVVLLWHYVVVVLLSSLNARAEWVLVFSVPTIPNDPLFTGKLQKLELQHNLITDISGLAEAQGLSTVNISFNKIGETDAGGVLASFSSLPNLSCLYLKGNPCTAQIDRFRKKFIAGTNFSNPTNPANLTDPSSPTKPLPLRS
jgi:Leucine-rich repeat (LRR) protein